MPSPDPFRSTALFEALRGVLCQVAEPIVVLRTILDEAVARTSADRGVFVEVSGEGELSFQVLHDFSRERLEGGRIHAHQHGLRISRSRVTLGEDRQDTAHL